MVPHKKYRPEDILHILWRRRWLTLIPLAAGLAAVPPLANLVPERYESETVVMVIPQRIPDSYVKATVTGSVEDRLPTISAQILSRNRLERIIEEFDLYKDARKTLPMEDVVRMMRQDIKGPSIEGNSRESFRLSFSSHDPVMAQKVTSRLASLYLEQNLRDRTNRADNTSQFIETELEDAKRRLIEHEKKLENFRLRHAGTLPSQLVGNLQVIQNTQQQLQNIGDSMNRAKERRLFNERQLADAKAPIPVVMDSSGVPAERATAAQQRDATRAALERESRRYRADHPEIVELQRALKQWEEKAAEEARLNADTQRPAAVTPAEAERQRRIRELEAEIEVIDRQLKAGQDEEARLRDTLAAFQQNVNAVPTRESELVELNRGYEVLKQTHDALLLKREESKIAANAERGQIGEQFSIIDRASLPERPFNQMRRLQLMAIGPLAGLGFGILLIGLLEYRDSTFKSEEEVHRALNLPVLALMPIMPDKKERRASFVRTLALDATATVCLLASATFIAVWHWQG
jgi:polysaccharide chain length determinant protein (PEP-CTERM system associated)